MSAVRIGVTVRRIYGHRGGGAVLILAGWSAVEGGTSPIS